LNRTFLAVLLLSTVLVQLHVFEANASTFTAAISDSEVRVNLNLSLDSNATLFRVLQVQLAGGDLESLKTALSEATAKNVPGASASEVSAFVVENSTRINVTISFTVTGSARTVGSPQKFDLSWRSLGVGAPLATGNLSYNRLGAAYLRPFFVRIANDTGVQFNLNRTIIVAEAQAMNVGGNFTLLDLKPLSTPLARWSRSYDASRGVTEITLRPQTVLDITVKAGPKQGFASYKFYANVGGKIILPGLVTVQEDVISAERGTEPYVALMILLIVSPLIAWVVLYLRRPKAPIGRGRR